MLITSERVDREVLNVITLWNGLHHFVWIFDGEGKVVFRGKSKILVMEGEDEKSP